MAIVTKCIHKDDKDLCISYEATADMGGEEFVYIECNGKKISVSHDQLVKLKDLIIEFKANVNVTMSV